MSLPVREHPAVPSGGMPRRPRRRRLPAAVLAGAVAVSLVAGFVATNVSASLAQRDLRAAWTQTRAAAGDLRPAALATWTPERGSPVARLRIPAIRLDAVVVSGAGAAGTRRGPAHLPASPLPGEEGLSIITGNRLGFGGFFSDLDRLRRGDRIDLETIRGPMRFTVTGVEVRHADRLEPGRSGGVPRLMLFAAASRLGGADRIVVTAEPTR